MCPPLFIPMCTAWTHIDANMQTGSGVVMVVVMVLRVCSPQPGGCGGDDDGGVVVGGGGGGVVMLQACSAQPSKPIMFASLECVNHFRLKLFAICFPWLHLFP